MFQSFNPKNVIQTPFLFLTGKGGVGKTSTASAAAVALADSGKRCCSSAQTQLPTYKMYLESV